jgi:Flp pilus assembly pilin Flp
MWGLKGLPDPLWRDRRGASLIEYALLISLISLVVIGFVSAVGKWANGVLANFLLR